MSTTINFPFRTGTDKFEQYYLISSTRTVPLPEFPYFKFLERANWLLNLLADEGFKKSCRRVRILLQNSCGSVELIPQHTNTMSVYNSPQVVSYFKWILNADEVAFITNASSPVFLILAGTPKVYFRSDTYKEINLTANELNIKSLETTSTHNLVMDTSWENCLHISISRSFLMHYHKAYKVSLNASGKLFWFVLPRQARQTMKTLAPSRYAKCIEETLKQVTVCKGSKGAMFSQNIVLLVIFLLWKKLLICSSQLLACNEITMLSRMIW